MNLQYRIDQLVRLGAYMRSGDTQWQEAKARAARENPWFIDEFIDRAVLSIADCYLQQHKLEKWVAAYKLPEIPLQVGIVMAGNIPLVGFHDWLSVYISGHQARIKLSAKDNVLLKHLLEIMGEWNEANQAQSGFEDMLKDCDAYIATGSNNSSRYFDYYFGKYPHIIRRNRTSVAVLTGEETIGDLELLADDVYSFFGLGCRNVTKIYVPVGYDFVSLLDTFRKYDRLTDYHKYKNNYDYNLAILLLNKKYYMTNGSILLAEATSFFSPISQLNYEYYADYTALIPSLQASADLQCIIGRGFTGFGQGQYPGLTDYADGIDTMNFLSQC